MKPFRLYATYETLARWANQTYRLEVDAPKIGTSTPVPLALYSEFEGMTHEQARDLCRRATCLLDAVRGDDWKTMLKWTPDCPGRLLVGMQHAGSLTQQVQDMILANSRNRGWLLHLTSRSFVVLVDHIDLPRDCPEISPLTLFCKIRDIHRIEFREGVEEWPKLSAAQFMYRVAQAKAAEKTDAEIRSEFEALMYEDRNKREAWCEEVYDCGAHGLCIIDWRRNRHEARWVFRQHVRTLPEKTT